MNELTNWPIFRETVAYFQKLYWKDILLSNALLEEKKESSPFAKFDHSKT